jgi:hypothetical protein
LLQAVELVSMRTLTACTDLSALLMTLGQPTVTNRDLIDRRSRGHTVGLETVGMSRSWRKQLA